MFTVGWVCCAGAPGGFGGEAAPLLPVSSHGTVRVTLVGFPPQTVQRVIVSVNPGGM